MFHCSASPWLQPTAKLQHQSCSLVKFVSEQCSARNNSWPLAIFRPISAFGQPKSILVGHISCTFSMGQKLITNKISYLQKNGRPISGPYF